MPEYLHVEKPFMEGLAALAGRCSTRACAWYRAILLRACAPFLMNKLSDALDDKQKRHFVTNLLQELRRNGVVWPDGATRGAKWRLYKADPEEKF